MIEAILAAVVAFATRGECMPADHYPLPDLTDGPPAFVLLGDGDNRCAIPIAPELPARAVCTIAWELADPTGQGAGIRCEIPEERT